MGWGKENTPGGPVAPFSEPTRIYPEVPPHPRTIDVGIEDAIVALRGAGFIVERREDLVTAMAAAIRADLVISPESLFRDARECAVQGVDWMDRKRRGEVL